MIKLFCKSTDIISAKVWRMLPCGNIRHTSKLLGIVFKQVYFEYFADTEQLLGVDGGLVVQPLESAAVDVQLVGEPLVGVALAAQFVSDKVAYVYLHVAICFCGRTRGYAPTVSVLPNPQKHSDDRRQKKKASNLVSCLRSWKLPFVDRQNARLSASICTLAFHKST